MNNTRKKVYFSASITGDGADSKLAMRVVNYLKQQGCEVLSEHVAFSDPGSARNFFFNKIKIDPTQLSDAEKGKIIRQTDTKWVDEADILVAVITGPSLGVGMEIERALLKKERRLQTTRVICFVPNSYLEHLSMMIKGIDDPDFVLTPFDSAEDIEQELSILLSK